MRPVQTFGSTSRVYQHPVEEIFSAWLDPKIRERVLIRNNYKGCIKEINPTVGGVERYEHRWKNRLYGHTTRKYVLIDKPTRIIAEVTRTTKGALIGPFEAEFNLKETLDFEPVELGTRLTVTEEVISIQPEDLESLQSGNMRWWELDLIEFGSLVSE